MNHVIDVHRKCWKQNEDSDRYRCSRGLKSGESSSWDSPLPIVTETSHFLFQFLSFTHATSATFRGVQFSPQWMCHVFKNAVNLKQSVTARNMQFSYLSHSREFWVYIQCNVDMCTLRFANWDKTASMFPMMPCIVPSILSTRRVNDWNQI